ncbi:MAG: hypothetical protein ACOCWZ_11380 [Spirochaetota bacterium]
MYSLVGILATGCRRASAAQDARKSAGPSLLRAILTSEVTRKY